MYLNFNYKRIYNTNKTIKKTLVKKAAIYYIDFLFLNKRNMKKKCDDLYMILIFRMFHLILKKIKIFACNLLSNLTSLLLWVVVSFFISYHNDLFFYRHKVHSLSLQVLSSVFTTCIITSDPHLRISHSGSLECMNAGSCSYVKEYRQVFGS